MLPPEGPNQNSNCGEKRPLDDSQRQSVLVQQKNGKNFKKFSINKEMILINLLLLTLKIVTRE